MVVQQARKAFSFVDSIGANAHASYGAYADWAGIIAAFKSISIRH